MFVSDAFTVTEDWIGEHYFTTDAKNESFTKRTTDLRKTWDATVKITPNTTTPLTRFKHHRATLQTAFTTLPAPNADGGLDDTDKKTLADLYALLRDILGYTAPWIHTRTHGPVTWYTPTPGARPTLAWINATPAESDEDITSREPNNLLTAYDTTTEHETHTSTTGDHAADDDAATTRGDDGAQDDPARTPTRPKDLITNAARLASHLLLATDGPKYVIIASGATMIISNDEGWPEGRYLIIDLQTVTERADYTRAGETDRALACLAATSFLNPHNPTEPWWDATLADSRRHAVGVSTELRDRVRESIEIIGNDIVTRRRTHNLPPLPDEHANTLARQALRYLYRILFVLYAEASPHLGILPVGAPEYDAGYSLTRLKDLVLRELTTTQARNGTHLYQSLNKLFTLIDQGHNNHTTAGKNNDHGAGDADSENSAHGQRSADGSGGDGDAAEGTSTAGNDGGGLVFHSLTADLFNPDATDLIDEVGLSNAAAQQVLQRLMLTKETAGKDRGFLSYTQLGINQLGAVYEGLMSYTGHFANQDMYEVAPGGDPSDGSWLLAVDQADDSYAAEWFVQRTDEHTGEQRPVIHDQGAFVYRLSGRERQQSASYYTAEVLTEFTVSQALDELLGENTDKLSAEEILNLTVCEPALGSGAFALEAVRQLADRYVKKRQQELKRQVPHDQYATEVQRVKAYLALHNTYGVDLNATAVELAEISLWLDTMLPGLQAPWFGLRLRRGNSLVGGRREIYTRTQVDAKKYLTEPGTPLPFDQTHSTKHGPQTEDTAAAHNGVAPERPREEPVEGVFQFLLPGAGWGAAATSADAKKLDPVAVKRLRDWAKTTTTKLPQGHVKRLIAASQRVEHLWAITLRRLQMAEYQSRRDIPVWGHDSTGAGNLTREHIETYLRNEATAYNRLRWVMDAWCALWFWPLTEHDIQPPSVDQWVDFIEKVLGAAGKKRAGSLVDLDTWEQIDAIETLDLAGAAPIADLVGDHPWLTVVRRVAEVQGFFHFGLDFAPVFAAGGFDVQVGNPPWVRPIVDMPAAYAEYDPWWKLANKPSEKVKKERLEHLTSEVVAFAVETSGDQVALASFVRDATTYPMLGGLQPDLYRCFMAQTWKHLTSHGVVALIHPDTHFTDTKAGVLREHTYQHLRRHWHFHNTLQFFDIGITVDYGVHTYGQGQSPRFMHAASLYHPDTVTGSLRHDGQGPEPGLKYEGSWDVRPHRARIQHVDVEVLDTWRDVLGSEVAPLRTPMVYTVNTASAAVLGKLSTAERIGSLDLQFSAGWHEKSDRAKGRFIQQWGPAAWQDAILQGPHLFVNTPLYKSINETMKNKQDWSATDFETLPADAVPVTQYRPAGDRATYDAQFTHWTTASGEKVPARDYYRIAWRYMAANTGERTLIPALMPPHATHINGINSCGSPGINVITLCIVLGCLSSLLSDYMVRAAPKSTVQSGQIVSLPLLRYEHPAAAGLVHRVVRLNAIAAAYSGLWAGSYDATFLRDSWSHLPSRQLRARGTIPRLGNVTPHWTPEIPLRRDADRRAAQVEIDAIVAVMLGVTAEELVTVYRTGFPVLHGYDQNKYLFDAEGRIVPNEVVKLWRKVGGNEGAHTLTRDDRTAAHPAGTVYTYELPFHFYDREADLRHAHAHFSKVAAEAGTE